MYHIILVIYLTYAFCESIDLSDYERKVLQIPYLKFDQEQTLLIPDQNNRIRWINDYNISIFWTIPNNYTYGGNYAPVECSGNSIPNLDKSECLECPGGNVCPPSDSLLISFFQRHNGTECPENYYIFDHQCIRCPVKVKSNGTGCDCEPLTLKPSDRISPAYCLTTISPVMSCPIGETETKLFNEKINIPMIASACSSASQLPSSPRLEYCQYYANLCVLSHHYNPDCNRFGGAISFPEPTYPVPKVVENVAIFGILSSTKIEYSYTFASNNHLNLYIFTYFVNGTLKSLERLDTQLFFCGGDVTNDWLRYGFNYVDNIICKITNSSNYPNYLYEIYHIYTVGNASYSDPVYVFDRLARRHSPTLVNKEFTENTNLYQMRFFIYDTSVSGYVRYANSMTLRFLASRTDKTKILPPILYIEYSEVQINSDISTVIHYEIQYSDSTSSIRSFINVWFWVWFVVSIFYGLLTVRRYMKYNSRTATDEDVDLGFFVISLIYIMSSVGLFLYIFIICSLSIYYFTFYKFQTIPYLIIPMQFPGLEEVSLFNDYRAVLYVTFFFHLIKIGFIIYRQVNCDLFFIDFEEPRTYDTINGNDAQKSKSEISTWRKLFVANEYNELQIQRRTSVEFSCFFILFLLKVVDWDRMYTAQPFFSRSSQSSNHMFLYTGAIILLWIIVTIAQIIFNYAIYERYISAPQEKSFIDLATIAKISIFIIDYKYHGYYLHCNLPTDHSDTDMQSLKQQLNSNAERGIPGYAQFRDDQSFEIYMTHLLRVEFYNLFDKTASRQKNMATAGFQSYIPCFKVDTNYNNEEYMAIQDFLKNYVVQSQPILHLRTILEPQAIYYRILDLPFGMDSTRNDSVWFPDRDSMLFVAKHTSVLFWGMEYEFLVHHTLIWLMTYEWFGNDLLSALLTYLVYRVIAALRQSYGKINIQKDSNIDEAFLV